MSWFYCVRLRGFAADGDYSSGGGGSMPNSMSMSLRTFILFWSMLICTPSCFCSFFRSESLLDNAPMCDLSSESFSVSDLFCSSSWCVYGSMYSSFSQSFLYPWMMNFILTS